MRRKKSIPYSWLLPAGALAIGEAIGLCGGEFASFWPLAAVASVLIALYGFGCGWRGWLPAAIALAGLSLAWRCEYRRYALLATATMSRGPFTVELDIVHEPIQKGQWVSFVSGCDGVSLEVIMPLAEGRKPRIGERWRVAGWLERKSQGYRRCRKLWVKGRKASATYVGEMRWSECYRRAARLRHCLSKALANGMEGRWVQVALHRAMLLGERAALPRAERENFIAAGTVHVFAISGLHVGVVAILIVMLMMLAFVPLRLAGVAMVPVLWGYVVIIGMPPSAVRAALMASCYFLAPAMWQRANALTAWAQAFIIVHGLNPESLASVGSLLSFTVMLAILVYDHWADAVALSGWGRSLGLVFAIWAAGVPIAAVVFERVTPGGMLANLAVVPLAAVAVSCGFLGMVASTGCPFLGAHFNNVAALVTDAMRGISAAVAALPGSNFETASWSLAQCAFWYLTLFVGAMTLLWLRRRSVF